MKRWIMLALLAAAPMAYAAEYWSYDTTGDQMTGKTVYNAAVLSDNSLRLGFPYAGPNYGHLQIRKHPRWGTDIIVYIDKGQILCGSYDGCSVLVRFDDAPAVTFEGAEPEDHSSEVLFLRNSKKFIEKARKAKKIRIQLRLFQGGEQVLVFSPAQALDWK